MGEMVINIYGSVYPLFRPPSSPNLLFCEPHLKNYTPLGIYLRVSNEIPSQNYFFHKCHFNDYFYVHTKC